MFSRVLLAACAVAMIVLSCTVADAQQCGSQQVDRTNLLLGQALGQAPLQQSGGCANGSCSASTASFPTANLLTFLPAAPAASASASASSVAAAPMRIFMTAMPVVTNTVTTQGVQLFATAPAAPAASASAAAGSAASAAATAATPAEVSLQQVLSADQLACSGGCGRVGLLGRLFGRRTISRARAVTITRG